MEDIKNLDEIYIEICKLIEQFQTEHNKFTGGAKSAAVKARSATTKLAAIFKEYRKQSVIKEKILSKSKKNVEYNF